jgi:glutaredoxin
MSLKSLALATALACLTLPAAALYKVVGPDGRITYTDRPPSDTGARVTTLNRESIVETPASDGLPLALRQTATRFPVTLYSTTDCPPCDAGRQLLVQRGVPFTEKLIVSDDDAQAMERTLGTRTVPALTIGAQALRGMSEGEWTAYLDAAGYPRASQLPKGWQVPTATPLVARSGAAPASAPARAAAPQRAASVPAPAVVLPPAPGGIRF